MIPLGARRWWALAALVLSMLTIGLDATVLNVALPTLAAALHAGTDALQWIVDAYILVFAGLMLPAGALGDRYGRKRLLIFGLAFFGVASAAAGHAGSAGQLIAARAVMGLGAAVLTPVVVAVLPVIFPPAERTRAIAVGTIGMALGLPLGPIVGGYLLQNFWWGSVFAINLPVAAVAVAAVAVLVPESCDPAPPRPDLRGAALSVVGLVALVYGLIEAPVRTWHDHLVLGTLAFGVLLLAAFFRWERHRTDPMIDLGLFGRRPFLLGTLATMVASFTLFGLLFVLPQYLQAVRGANALGTGVRLLPLIAGLVVGARASATMTTRIGHRTPIAAGLVLIAAGLALGATTTPQTGYTFAATWLPVVGAGAGLTLAPAMDAVLRELPPARAGSGTAITMTVRQVGAALGVAVLGSISASAYIHQLDVTGLPAATARIAQDSVHAAVALAGQLAVPALEDSAHSAYTHAMDVVLACCAGVALIGSVLIATLMPPQARAAAEDAPPPSLRENRTGRSLPWPDGAPPAAADATSLTTSPGPRRSACRRQRRVTHEPPVAQQPTETTFDHAPARNGFATLLYAAVWRLCTRRLAAGAMELRALILIAEE